MKLQQWLPRLLATTTFVLLLLLLRDLVTLSNPPSNNPSPAVLKHPFWATTTSNNCSQFRTLNSARLNYLSNLCDKLGDSATERTLPTYLYYQYDLQVCGTSEPLGTTMYQTTPTKLATKTGRKRRVLYTGGDPLARLKRYHSTIRDGIGYYFLGEKIVTRYRDRGEGLGADLRRLYEARLSAATSLLDPRGPTFPEFLRWVADTRDTSITQLYPVVQGCLPCQVQYTHVVATERELECLLERSPETGDRQSDTVGRSEKSPVYLLDIIFARFYHDIAILS
eukprot:sb/3467876/